MSWHFVTTPSCIAWLRMQHLDTVDRKPHPQLPILHRTRTLGPYWFDNNVTMIGNISERGSSTFVGSSDVLHAWGAFIMHGGLLLCMGGFYSFIVS